MLNEDEFSALVELAHIACTPEEEVKFRDSLGRILGYVEQLQQVPTDGVEPCIQVFPFENRLREDQEGELISKQKFLGNAPDIVGGLIRVPSVIKFE